MKIALILSGFLLLFSPAASFAQAPPSAPATQTELNQRLWDSAAENRQRIERLERTIERLQRQIGTLEDQVDRLGAKGSQRDVDPLVGSWQCTNNVFTYTIVFKRNGQVIQQEPTFGNARNTSWSRMSDSEVAIAGHVVLRTDFYSDDSFTMTDVRNNAQWECSRQ